MKGTKKDRPDGIPKNTSQTAKFRPNRPFGQSFRMPRVEALNHRLVQVLPKESLNWMAFPKEFRPELSDSVNFARRFHRRVQISLKNSVLKRKLFLYPHKLFTQVHVRANIGKLLFCCVSGQPSFGSLFSCGLLLGLYMRLLEHRKHHTRHKGFGFFASQT